MSEIDSQKWDQTSKINRTKNQKMLNKVLKRLVHSELILHRHVHLIFIYSLLQIPQVLILIGCNFWRRHTKK